MAHLQAMPVPTNWAVMKIKALRMDSHMTLYLTRPFSVRANWYLHYFDAQMRVDISHINKSSIQ